MEWTVGYLENYIADAQPYGKITPRDSYRMPSRLVDAIIAFDHGDPDAFPEGETYILERIE